LPMIVGELQVGRCDRLRLGRDARDVLAGNHHVELVLEKSVYTRLPTQPVLAMTPCVIDAGNAMHVGRPSSGAGAAIPARSAASCRSITRPGRPATRTTSGSTGDSPSGA